ncbi:raffinose/stachyose/melibiose transport system permease protein [Mycoplasmoides fastidiosum]|uniref:Raffinose/stachyose/melibiose transport system permease protein n=1 Tax=Mycoplasmoides fastidiosum TaxID=92758 RepID=A0ABU0LZ23_9BACT|nr:carbohydrate ABC transporter permease [Mycoplasmoides fastidiosum]MDQ0513840.1 raffinose/stachyose/melibiose transport system permease protein [Mycoplasmoides fastidiosum]UUD37744.1 carbohydrate ABC transporter permease [Mycoplasmoides fastidiosum]
MFGTQIHLKEKRDALKISGRITFFTFLTIIALVWLFPFFLMVNTSFKDISQLVLNDIWAFPKPYETESWNQAFKALDFVQSFFTSLLVTIFSNFFIVLFSSLAAWQISRSKKWYAKFLFYLLLIVMIVPFQAIMLPLISVMAKMSFINLPGLIFMYTGFGMSLSIFMMTGFLKSVPISLEEVARVEGYNPIRVYFKIILPLLRPIITTIVILNTMWIWNDFLLPYLVYQQNQNGFTTTVVKLYDGLVGTYGTDYTALMAGLTILIIPITIFFIFVQKNIISGITNGAVK